MNTWTPIKYMGFWDIPRIFIARHGSETFLFDCSFDEKLDDYPDAYQVFLLPALGDEDLPKDWTTLKTRASRYLGEVAVTSLVFDPTKRRQVDTAILDDLLNRKVAG